MRAQRFAAFGGFLTAPLLLAPALLTAQPLTQQPNGGYEYPTSYSTVGTFSCSGRLFPAGGSCAASGSSLTISGGGGSFTLSFAGVSGSVVAKTIETQRVNIGSILTSVSGPFSVPSVVNRHDPMFFLSIGGLSSNNRLGFAGLYISPMELALVPDGSFSTTSIGGPRLSLVWHSPRLDRPLSLTNGTIGVSGEIGIIPEPSTWTLLGTGLVALGSVAAARRKRTSV